MPKKYKFTGFARFVVVMLFITPIAFLIASYYNGEDGFENLKKMLHIGQQQEEVVYQETTDRTPEAAETIKTPPAEQAEAASAKNSTTNADIQKLQKELEFKNQRLEDVYKVNDELRKQLQERDEEIAQLKKQLKGQ